MLIAVVLLCLGQDGDAELKALVAQSKAYLPTVIGRVDREVRDLEAKLALVKRARINPKLTSPAAKTDTQYTYRTKELRDDEAKELTATLDAARDRLAKLKTGKELGLPTLHEVTEPGECYVIGPGKAVDRIDATSCLWRVEGRLFLVRGLPDTKAASSLELADTIVRVGPRADTPRGKATIADRVDRAKAEAALRGGR